MLDIALMRVWSLAGLVSSYVKQYMSTLFSQVLNTSRLLAPSYGIMAIGNFTLRRCSFGVPMRGFIPTLWSILSTIYCRQRSHQCSQTSESSLNRDGDLF